METPPIMLQAAGHTADRSCGCSVQAVIPDKPRHQFLPSPDRKITSFGDIWSLSRHHEGTINGPPLNPSIRQWCDVQGVSRAALNCVPLDA